MINCFHSGAAITEIIATDLSPYRTCATEHTSKKRACCLFFTDNKPLVVQISLTLKFRLN